jgi:phosphotransferase system HPr-like phosphotransfer protein
MNRDSKACDISFSEKVKIFSADYLKCCRYISEFEHPQHFFTKKLYSKMTSTSQLLEDFLDFHGAKNSSEWYLYREYAAAVRHLTTAAYSQMHISNRMAFYLLSDTEEFQKEGASTLNFLNETLIKMAPVIMEEAQRLDISMPDEKFSPGDFPGISTGEMLPFDIDDENKNQQKEHIVYIASEFLNISKKFDEISFYEPYSPEALRNMVPSKINEVEMRRFEMLVHNLQSAFDTYVIHGGYRFGNRKLKQIRGHFSVVFHLLQVVGRLLHFYERHLHEAGYKDTYKRVNDRLSTLIDPQQLLDRTVNYAVYYVCHYMSTGKELAREILNENIEKSSITVGIPQKLGFHSRPSLLVAKIVQYYGGQVELCVASDRFDASSVLDIQWAGGKIQKENIQQVVFEGDRRALEDIEVLADVNYGEDTLGKGVPLPKQLNYLR